MTEILIDTEYLTMGQLLKHVNLISSGGEAKYFLAEVEVLLNGEPENRRGKKLYNADVIKVDGVEYQIICS